MNLPRLVLFVEGEGDVDAGHALVKRLISERSPEAWNSIHLDEDPLRVGSIPKLLKNDADEWRRQLGNASKRRNFSAGLLIVDGDLDRLFQKPFCARETASLLAQYAERWGAGSRFSIAVVIARQEFESWLIPGFVEKFNTQAAAGSASLDVPADLEAAPRDAKGWLRQRRQGGYSPSADQAVLAQSINLDAIRRLQLRSFRRLESAVGQLVKAMMEGVTISSPPPLQM
jgi:hypothetical protein